MAGAEFNWKPKFIVPHGNGFRECDCDWKWAGAPPALPKGLVAERGTRRISISGTPQEPGRIEGKFTYATPSSSDGRVFKGTVTLRIQILPYHPNLGAPRARRIKVSSVPKEVRLREWSSISLKIEEVPAADSPITAYNGRMLKAGWNVDGLPEGGARLSERGDSLRGSCADGASLSFYPTETGTFQVKVSCTYQMEHMAEPCTVETEFTLVVVK